MSWRSISLWATFSWEEFFSLWILLPSHSCCSFAGEGFVCNIKNNTSKPILSHHSFVSICNEYNINIPSTTFSIMLRIWYWNLKIIMLLISQLQLPLPYKTLPSDLTLVFGFWLWRFVNIKLWAHPSVCQIYYSFVCVCILCCMQACEYDLPYAIGVFSCFFFVMHISLFIPIHTHNTLNTRFVRVSYLNSQTYDAI